jgi:hypothetical protein
MRQIIGGAMICPGKVRISVPSYGLVQISHYHRFNYLKLFISHQQNQLRGVEKLAVDPDLETGEGNWKVKKNLKKKDGNTNL